MHGLIMGSSKDICSLFDSYIPHHEASTHEITWRMFSTKLWSSAKKNQIKQSSYVTVMPLTNQKIFNSREFKPPEKLEMANLLSDEPKTNSIMTKVIIHVINVHEILGLEGFEKDSKTYLFGPNGETDKILVKRKDGFRPGLKGTCLSLYQEHILHFSKSWSTLSCFLMRLSLSEQLLFRWTCASYQATFRNPSFGGLVSGGREILLAEELSNIGVVNKNFKINSLIFLSCVSSLACLEKSIGLLDLFS
ncbi:hypothetical protein YC2023_094161 [Brassica napus]